MSLTVNEKAAPTTAPIQEGTHTAVCVWVIDLGMQYNESFKNSQRKVMLGWELPGITIETEDGTHNRIINKRYTASLNEMSNLRRDLSAWRGRNFTEEELEEFNLRNIVGASCLLNIINNTKNGKTYTNIQSIMALPKGMQKVKGIEEEIVFDLDESNDEDIDCLPKWIADIVRKSETYKNRTNVIAAAYNPPPFEEIEDDGELPF